jgi:hypothetical protein
MKFTYPEFLWALFFLLIPVIIHLFNFRRYKVLYFSSLRFIKRVEQETRSTQRLKHLLVLLSRLLALAFLIIAFAQPYKPVENKNSQGGKPVMAVYIDNSFSMTAKGTEGELLSEARETARKLIDKASLNTLFLLHTNLMNGLEQRLISKVEALERLDKIQPTPLTRKIGDVITWQRAFIKSESETRRKIGSIQHVLLSDFQKKDLSNASISKDDVGYYYPILFQPQSNQNISIDSVWFSSPVRKIGDNNELNIRIRNFGNESVTNAEMHVEIGKIKRDVFIDVDANSSKETVVNYTEASSGMKKGKITLNDKQLFWDDDFYFSYQVDDHTSILVINGDKAEAPVSKVYALERYYIQKSIRESEFSADLLRNTDLVVLNGIDELSTGMTDELLEFSNSGGTLAIFPGAHSVLSSYSDLLSALNLPALTDVTTSGTGIRTINYDDPFFDGMFEKKNDDLRLPTLKKAFRTAGTQSSDYLPLITADNGSPLMLRSGGILNTFLFCSSLESDFGSFTNNTLFPSILLRIAEMSQRKAPIALTIGKEANYPLYHKADSESPVHIRSEKIDFIPQIQSKGALTFISFNGQEALEMLSAGNYDIVDDKPEAPLSLNYDRSESSTECFSKTELTDLLESSGIAHISAYQVNEGQSVTQIDIEKPFEYWKWFIALSLLFLFAELALLKFWK